jgi:formate hydrogenlyase transcriptional activator
MLELRNSTLTHFTPEQYAALLEVAEVIALRRDLHELFHDLAQRLPRVVPFDYINLVLHDAARDVMRLNVLVAPEHSTIKPGLELPIDESPAGIVWTTQQAVVVEDAALESRFPQLTPLLLENGIRSFCLVPVTTALRRLGAMGFGSTRPHAYEDTELDFMRHVAAQVAVAVDNVLHDESAKSAQRQLACERDRVQLLLEVNNAVVTHLDLDDLFVATSACLRKVIQHDGAALALLDPQTGRYRVHVLLFDKNESFIEEELTEPACIAPTDLAISTRKPSVFSEQGLRDLCSQRPNTQCLLDKGVKAFCSLPLVFHDQVLGALNVGRCCEDAFTLEEVELLNEVAKQIAIAVENARAYRQITVLKDTLAKEKLYLEEEIRTEQNFEEIVGESAALRRVLKEVETVAPTDSTVLIRGETGTGKELIARALHQLSPRRERTFVKINCAAIPTGLLESELFGHEKGAFTGAITQKIGRFELAHQGTLFLDEVGDIPAELQPKLLRVLQEQEFERLGSTRTVRVDVRLVAATNRDLGQMAADGQFRSDLFYRLNVFPVLLPPLRERRDDIPRLVRHFAQMVARRMGRRIETIPAETMDALVQYPWPGNIRELENVIERGVILSPGTSLHVNLSELVVRGERLPADGQKSGFDRTNELRSTPSSPNSGSTLADAERDHILDVLNETDWVLGGPKGAAARLALKRTTLQSKMKKLGIARPRSS